MGLLIFSLAQGKSYHPRKVEYKFLVLDNLLQLIGVRDITIHAANPSLHKMEGGAAAILKCIEDRNDMAFLFCFPRQECSNKPSTAQPFSTSTDELNLSAELGFEEYIDKCVAYDSGQKTPAAGQSGLNNANNPK